MLLKTSISHCALVLACIGIAAFGYSTSHAQGAQRTTTIAQTPNMTAKPMNAAESEAMLFSRKLGIGWNLGNTLEATGNPNLKSVSEYETSWGNPVTTKAVIHGIKASGFNFVRIPVAWSNLMGPDYTINQELMARVEEVAKYGLDDGMYVMINIHWDGGWFQKFSTDYDESMKKYKVVWNQISSRFKNYSDHLIFESLNEEGSFPDLWNRYTNNPNQKAKAYETLNSINQEFTNLVRASGGNNRQRYLLIAGYATDIGLTVDPAFKMPQDPVAHSMVSVHYYSPATFALLTEDADWGKVAYTWGTPEEVAAVRTDLLPLKERFIDRGIPVILGEFGSAVTKKDPASVVKYLSTVGQTAYSLGLVPVLWDPGDHYNRRTLQWNNPQIGQAMAQIAARKQP